MRRQWSWEEALLNQYVNQTFYESFNSTIGVDFYLKNLKINKENIKLQIWDTAGQERFNAVCSAFYRGADCCVLVYDVTDRVSFENLELWRAKFISAANVALNDDFPFVLIGNKSDLQDREVSSELAKNWADFDDIPFFETSAKTAVDVDKAFLKVAQLVEKRQPWEVVHPIEYNEDTRPQSSTREKSNCC
uniref:Uncharacterized protein n=1 Tax=Megaselia scalaris TaxID=36166 RepID=T1GTA9_MEGSC